MDVPHETTLIRIEQRYGFGSTKSSAISGKQHNVQEAVNSNNLNKNCTMTLKQCFTRSSSSRVLNKTVGESE